MKRGKRTNIRNKLVALALALAMLVCGAIGGTLAWLTDQTDEVTNVFTTSDINITLTETTGDEYKMIPGWTIDKDPIVTVEKGSEDAWIFIEVDEGPAQIVDKDLPMPMILHPLEDYITYAIDTNNWTLVPGEDNVYYTKYTNRNDKDVDIKVLAGGSMTQDGVDYKWERNQVLVKPTVTKEMMDELDAEGAVMPTLIFTAYAAQLYKTNGLEFTPAEAWAVISGT